jgi:hypothetical protein
LVVRRCIVCSLCLALSFASNFSFAFVDFAALLAIIFLAWRKRGAPSVGAGRLLAACVLPGLIVTLFLSASVVLKWPNGELRYGATSLQETFGSVIRASLYEVNPHVANPLVYKAASLLKPYLFPVLGLAVLCQVLLIAFGRTWQRSRRLVELGAILAVIPIVSLLIHWMAFKLFHLLLPMDRTAIYVAAFWFLIAGIAAAVPLPWQFGKAAGNCLTVVLLSFGIYFLLCLRLTYFKEWKWDADGKSIYAVIAYYNHEHGIQEITTGWPFTSVLNFYRTLSGKETFGEFVSVNEYPPGKKVYVLLYPFDMDFVTKNGLKVVYRGETSDAVIAVSPSLASACR